MSWRSMAFGTTLAAVGAVLLWLTDLDGISEATSSTNAGNQFPTVVGNAGPVLTLLLVSLSASLLVGFGVAQALRGRFRLDTRGLRAGLACVLAGVALSINALILPWWQFSYQVNGYTYCHGTWVFYPWYLQVSDVCSSIPNSADWWYSNPRLFSHGGAVAIDASYGVLIAAALGLAAALLVLRRRSRGALTGRRTSWGLVLGLSAAAADAGAAVYFAVALPSALSADNYGLASYYAYDTSFWGSAIRPGNPSEMFFWGPDWTWVLVVVAGALLVTGAVVSYLSSRGRTGVAATNSPPRGA